MISPYVPGNGINTYQTALEPTGGTPTTLHGHGSPEGVLAGTPGCMYYDLDSTNAWIKSSGYDKVGWIRNGSQPAPGSAASAQIFTGTGSPVGVIFPTTSAAFYTQQDSTPPGLVWSYYSGAWH